MQHAAGSLSAVQRRRNTGGYVIFPEPLSLGEKKPASISVSPLHLQGRERRVKIKMVYNLFDPVWQQGGKKKKMAQLGLILVKNNPDSSESYVVAKG